MDWFKDLLKSAKFTTVQVCIILFGLFLIYKYVEMRLDSLNETMKRAVADEVTKYKGGLSQAEIAKNDQYNQDKNDLKAISRDIILQGNREFTEINNRISKIEAHWKQEIRKPAGAIGDHFGPLQDKYIAKAELPTNEKIEAAYKGESKPDRKRNPSAIPTSKAMAPEVPRLKDE